MKSLVLTILTFCLFSAQAQYRGGLEMGANLMTSTLEFDEPLSVNPTWGLRFGYVAEYNFNKDFYMRSGMVLNQRGFGNEGARLGINAVTIPVNIGYVITIKQDKLQLFVETGAEAEANVSAFTRIDGEVQGITIGNGEDDLKRLATGIDVSTGLVFSDKVKVRFEYYHGLTNQIRTPGFIWKNKVYGLMFDYFF